MLLVLLLPLLLLAKVPDTLADQCQRPVGYEPVPLKCDAYIECKNSVATEKVCDDGLHFNPNVEWPNYPCGFPSEVKCDEQHKPQPAQPSLECPHQFGYFRTDECGAYKMCYKGISKVVKCAPGLVFNTDLETCDWPSEVRDCNRAIDLAAFTCPAPSNEIQEHTIIILNRYGKSCSKFVACLGGYPRLLGCDPELHFDDTTRRCVRPDHFSDCEP